MRNDLGGWFEPALAIAEPGGLKRRVRPVWSGAIGVAGADFDAVTGRFEADGMVEGWATVTGTWSGGQLRVDRQDAPVPEPTARARWVTPPCPPPDGVRDYLRQGWQSWDLYQLGPQHAQDGQAYIAARLVRVRPQIADWAASLPSGILALEPWLTPARGDRGITS